MDFIADLLARLRAKNVTQTETAAKTGIPQPRLSDWSKETPETALDVLRLVKFARTFGIKGDSRLLKHRKPRPSAPAKKGR